MVVLLSLLLVAGCAQTQTHRATGTAAVRDADPSVLFMPPDILLQELTAGSQLNTNAAWTKSGINNVTQSIKQTLGRRGVALVNYANNDQLSESSIAERHQQIVKLHEAVGNTILLHKYNPQFALPTKEDRFDWTLSDAAAVLRREYDADYALFVFIRDTFASGGRVAFIVAAALLGVNVASGSQTGFASLVDLDSGDIVWFNFLASGTGDLRNPARARDAVERLLSGFPI